MTTFQPQMPQLQVPETVRNAGENIGTALNSAKESVNTAVSGFGQQVNDGTTASQSFLESNTIIAKFAFIILVIIFFIIFLLLGIQLIQYFVSPPSNPYIIYGMSDGNNSLIIQTDPSQTASVQIDRSNNKANGIESSWSTWIFIKDLGTTSSPAYQHILNKGDTSYATNGIASVNNAPGIYLITPPTQTAQGKPESATLQIIMDTVNVNDTNNVITIANVPIHKWVHLLIRLENTIMDVYVNGIVSQRLVLQDVPKQNFNTINVCQNGGFSGQISNLRYYSYALNAFEINTIVSGGPNLTQTGLSSLTANNYYTYLSNVWYQSKL